MKADGEQVAVKLAPGLDWTVYFVSEQV